jgi:hypothetical protein
MKGGRLCETCGGWGKLPPIEPATEAAQVILVTAGKVWMPTRKQLRSSESCTVNYVCVIPTTGPDRCIDFQL